MSINETGASCSQCGCYNCQYLCAECCYELLLEAGIQKEKALKLLQDKWINLENWEIEEAENNVKKRMA